LLLKSMDIFLRDAFLKSEVTPPSNVVSFGGVTSDEVHTTFKKRKFRLFVVGKSLLFPCMAETIRLFADRLRQGAGLVCRQGFYGVVQP